MACWVFKALSDVNVIDEGYAATDCEEMKNTVEDFRFDKIKIYMRSEENAQDHPLSG